ncbi:MAG: hypothetical protein LBE09_01590 [Christensenellaceae bacterium]|jgi:NitT/TauT family transport system substrate-binding protein|nr:hypothetical protein [Christensenellaceae bacterium]
MKMRFLKILCLALVIVSIVAVSTACVKDVENQDKFTIYVPDGAPLLALTDALAHDKLTTSEYKVDYTVIANADQLSAALLQEEPDFAIAPINVCSLMYNKGADYRLAAVSIWGILHIVSSEESPTLESLKGNSILAFAKAGTPGITLKYLLTQSDIKYTEDSSIGASVAADTVNIIYLTDAPAIKDQLVIGSLDNVDIKFALLPEPVATAIAGATSKKYSAKINLQTEWEKINPSTRYPQAGLIVHKRVIDAHPEFVDHVINACKASAAAAAANPAEIGDLAVSALKSNAIPNGTIVASAVTGNRLSFDFTLSKDSKLAVNKYLEILYNQNPTIVGDKIADEAFYYYVSGE